MIRLSHRLLDPFRILFRPFFSTSTFHHSGPFPLFLFTLLIYPSMHDSLTTVFETQSYPHAPLISLTIPIPIILLYKTAIQLPCNGNTLRNSTVFQYLGNQVEYRLGLSRHATLTQIILLASIIQHGSVTRSYIVLPITIFL